MIKVAFLLLKIVLLHSRLVYENVHLRRHFFFLEEISMTICFGCQIQLIADVLKYNSGTHLTFNFFLPRGQL